LEHESFNLTDRTSDGYLQLNSCGIRSVYETDASVLRSRGRSDYHMLYLKSGSAEVGIGEQTLRMDAGQLIFYLPYERQYYFFPAAERPISYWLHFCGTGVGEIFAQCGITGSTIFTPGDKALFEAKFLELIGEYNRLDHSPCAEAGLFMQLMALITRPSEDSAPEAVLLHRINDVIAYINQNYREKVDLDKYARICFVGKSRFMHVFKEMTGQSVHSYQTQVRLQNAWELLRFSSLNVSQTAYEVGYDDPLYFSRVFRKHYGISPNQLKQER